MRRVLTFIVVALALLVTTGVVRAQQGAPAAAAAVSTPPAALGWAYGIVPGTPLPGAGGARAGGGAGGGGAAAGGGGAAGGARAGAPAPDPTPLSVPGSSLTFMRAQIGGGGGNPVADWFPGDHPTMPDFVSKGRDAVRACGLCHYPNGKGRAENAGVAGLPKEYFVQQLSDFRADLRKSAEPRKANTNAMIAIAKAMTPEEIQQAADYFGSMKWTPWIKVQEAAMVPKTRIAGGLYLKLEGTETEPIAGRIIEVPEFTERTEVTRDPRAGFIAYVPVGAVKKGETLVTTGGAGKTIACGNCHGADLQGLGPVPGLAGRSPSYLARQMYDMKAGARHGVWTELMKPVVTKLTDDDLTNIVAYVASRPAAAQAPATR